MAPPTAWAVTSSGAGPLPAGAGGRVLGALRYGTGCHGQGFFITAAYGAVTIPDESLDSVGALTLADARMYQRKKGGRVPPAVSRPTC